MRIERDGIGAVEPEVAQAVGRARRTGVCPVLTGVAADPRQPEPARTRAFALLLAAVATSPRPQTSAAA